MRLSFALLLSSVFVAPVMAQDAMFRMQLNSPLIITDQGNGGEDPNPGVNNPENIELALGAHTFPEYSVGDSFSYDFNRLLSVTGGNDIEVDWSLGTPSSLPVSFNTTTGIAEGDLDLAGEHHFQIIAEHPDADNPAQQIYTIVVNGVEMQFTQISAGTSHTCGVTPQRTVYCWGNGSYGRLGNDGTADSSIPVQVVGGEQGGAYLSGVSQVSAGSSHACAVTNSGTYCWGAGRSGQLGNNATGATNSTPIRVVGGEQGGSHLSGVSQISAGTSHTCAVTNSDAYCWGSGANGRLGNEDTKNSSIPIRVVGGEQGGTYLSGVSQISANGSHTCAVTSSGAYCWGYGGSGRLGNDGTTTVPHPVQVVGGEQGGSHLSGVSQISAGGLHTCAVTSSGAYCWGSSGDGRLGNNATANSSRTPRRVHGGEQGGTYLSGVSQISASGNHTCAVASSGVYCWGSGANGRLGNDATGTANPTPLRVVGGEQDVNYLSGVSEVSAGDQHTCAVTSSGAYCWGDGSSGQLGNDAVTSSHLPVRVVGH